MSTASDKPNPVLIWGPIIVAIVSVLLTNRATMNASREASREALRLKNLIDIHELAMSAASTQMVNISKNHTVDLSTPEGMLQYYNLIGAEDFNELLRRLALYVPGKAVVDLEGKFKKNEERAAKEAETQGWTDTQKAIMKVALDYETIEDEIVNIIRAYW